MPKVYQEGFVILKCSAAESIYKFVVIKFIFLYINSIQSFSLKLAVQLFPFLISIILLSTSFEVSKRFCYNAAHCKSGY